ncbi:MAG TPA: chemotaxis protein CheW [Gemmatimonadaceae bacterium]|nr:chemotaxis protein CheW [Gemmatimonadaceae bacterium]
MTDPAHGATAVVGLDPYLDEVEEPEVHVATRRLIVFVVSGRSFACEMGAVREVVPSQAVTRLPGAPKEVCGLINLRGTIVTVLDLGHKLGHTACNTREGLILLAEYGEKLVGLGVDEVRDILDVPVDNLSPLGKLAEADSHIVTAVAKIDDHEVMVLEIKEVVREILG